MDFIYEPNRLYNTAKDGSILAEIDFPKMENEDAIIITHTFVDPSLRGQGIANKLLDQVVLIARENNLKIKPECSFAKRVFELTPKYQDLIFK